MGISIKMTTSMSEIDDVIRKETEKVDKIMLRALTYIGDECVNIARGDHPNNWTDRYGPLRSSIGFVIVHDGKVVSISDFQQVKDGAEGSREGKSYALELARGSHHGWCLIIVAGMHYASYVAKYRDVTASAELYAQAEAEKIMNEMKSIFD